MTGDREISVFSKWLVFINVYRGCLVWFTHLGRILLICALIAPLAYLKLIAMFSCVCIALSVAPLRP
jgi:hypothetical protein